MFGWCSSFLVLQNGIALSQKKKLYVTPPCCFLAAAVSVWVEEVNELPWAWERAVSSSASDGPGDGRLRGAPLGTPTVCFGRHLDRRRDTPGTRFLPSTWFLEKTKIPYINNDFLMVLEKHKKNGFQLQQKVCTYIWIYRYSRLD